MRMNSKKLVIMGLLGIAFTILWLCFHVGLMKSHWFITLDGFLSGFMGAWIFVSFLVTFVGALASIITITIAMDL